MHMTPTETLVEEDPELENGFEWIDGQVVEKPMGAQSGVVGGNLYHEMRKFLATNEVGVVFPAEIGYRISVGSSRRVRKPDLTFVGPGRLTDNRPPRGNISIAPDLAVEVISPNDLAEDIEQRIADFFSVGTRLFWVVYPAIRSVWVLRQDGSAARLTESQDLTGEDVVPGFTCRVADLFAGI
jgi:Uma2 family endonuclease